jgi:tricorn protease
VSYPRFSRDGTSVAWTSWRDGSPDVYLVDSEGSDQTRLTYWGDNATRVAGWASVGEVLAITAAGPDALQVAAVTGEPSSVRLAEGLIGPVLSLAASPDGAMVAAAAHDGRLLVVEVASGQVTELAASDDGAIEGLSWSPDSAWLAWSQPGPRPRGRTAR